MAEKTFWDHLDDIRKVIFRIIIISVLVAVAYFIFMPIIFDNIILAPTKNDFAFYSFLRDLGGIFNLNDSFFTDNFNVRLINIDLTAPFMIQISSSFYMALITIMPYIFAEIWMYISPALYDNEKRGIRKVLLFGTFMFYIGVLLGYFVIFPLTLRFLATYNLSSSINNMLSLTSYIDNFVMLILMMGLAFEIPLIMWLLSLLGVINRSIFIKYRRHAIVVFVILAAIITPTSDPFTLTVVFVPLYMLYELSILMIRDKKE